MNNEMINAYLNAKYVIQTDSENYILRVGQKHVFIDRLLQKENQHLAVFITADNPFSMHLSANENALRRLRFEQLLEKMQLTFIKGYGTDDAEKWDREQSYFIFVDNKNTADELAAKFGQNGFLLIQFNKPVELRLLKPYAYFDYTKM